MEMYIFGSCACKASIWAIQSQELLHGRRYQGLVVAKSLLQCLVHREVMTYGTNQYRWSDHTYYQSLSQTTAVRYQ